MIKALGSLLCALTLAVPAVAAQSAPALRLIQKIVLPSVDGRIDHLDADLAHGRLLVSALGNDTLEVVDLRSGKLIRTVRGLDEPQGVTYVPRFNRIFVANGGDGTVRCYDANSFTLTKTVHLASDADDTRDDATRRRVYVGYGHRRHAGIAVFDSRTCSLLAAIKLTGHPESFQLENSGPRIFVNIPTAGDIVDVINRETRRVIATWKLAGASANFPMALDESDHRLFVGSRRPAEILMIDSDSGKIVARVPCAGDADDLWYDAVRRRIYVSGGEGLITVLSQRDANHYRRMAEIPTQPGARTSLFIPGMKRFYLAVRRRGNQPAAIWVYAVEP